MKPRFKTKLRPFKGMPDITPLINVVLLLLIFFTLSSSFVQISGIKISLPETTVGGESFMEKYIITVDGSNHIFFNDMPKTLDEIKGDLDELKIRTAKKGQNGKDGEMAERHTIIIRSDKDAPYGTAVQLIALAMSNNFNVYVATLPEEMKEKNFDD